MCLFETAAAAKKKDLKSYAKNPREQKETQFCGFFFSALPSSSDEAEIVAEEKHHHGLTICDSD
jgi:hypothetical protein